METDKNEGIADEAGEEKQNPGSSFDEELFVGGRVKERMTRRQKRAVRKVHQLVRGGCKSLDIGPEELKDLQESDPTLAGISVDGTKDTSTAQMDSFTDIGSQRGTVLNQPWLNWFYQHNAARQSCS